MNTIPRNTTAFGERFIFPIIRRFPNRNALFQLSKLTGLCEPTCRKIVTRPQPDLNTIRQVLIMCEIISETPSEYDENIMKAVRGMDGYQNAKRRLQRKEQRGMK